MNTIPRFMNEYASYKRKQVNARQMFTEQERQELCSTIDRCLSAYARGLMTVDGVMRKMTEL